mmetsp:Transcript_17397/g.44554  ORF Transcript_17397/g.44554 Transcript_17397/m.44554 type:complete len:117 (+) Transcript_17397:212-562(+)|eukprot:jgi/Tetstr1/436441/TSEL_025270.t1
MGRDPINITRLVKQNEQYSRAEAHAKSLLRGGETAAWHESAFKAAGAPVPVPTGKTAEYSATSSRATAEIMGELTAGRTTVMIERKARLKQLLESERMMYEDELNAQGLAIEKYAF